MKAFKFRKCCTIFGTLLLLLLVANVVITIWDLGLREEWKLGIDRTLLISKLFPKKSETAATTTATDWRRKQPFKILFWTSWYGYQADTVGAFVRLECQDEFTITSNKLEMKSADAIIFSFVDIYRKHKIELPPNRSPDVPWILALEEAAIQHPIPTKDLKRYDGLFNWTLSYRSDSLIHPNFTELFKTYKEPDKRWIFGSPFSAEFLRRKSKVAAWVVSNCFMVKSKRQELATALATLGVGIDTYGKCGRQTCPPGEKCFSLLGLTHKFYLAFENSLCEDYITEKIYHGLLHGMVPVIYALGNVGMRAPPNSFINVLDYATVSELADKLLYLDQYPEEYFKYFEWRQWYDINISNSSRYHCHHWRKIKEFTLKLRSDDEEEALKYRHVYANFTEWYTQFHNQKLGKMCGVCLPMEQINLRYLSENKDNMYNNRDRCH